MLVRLPRWTVLLLLPLLVGALLVMHGLGASSSANAPDATVAHPAEVVTSQTYDQLTPAGHEDRGCAHCTAGHLMAACVAVIVSLGAVRPRRPAGVKGHATMPAWAAAGWLRCQRDVIHRPDPAWIRLAVMLH